MMILLLYCFYCPCELTLSIKWNGAMAHMFQQIYVDEIDLSSMSCEQLIEFVFTEVVHQGMNLLEEGDVDVTDRRLFSTENEDVNRWSTYSEKAMLMINFNAIWFCILHAFRILNYAQPSS